MSRLHVVHTTTFSYDGAVAASYNEARMIPRSDAGQTVLAATLGIEPHSWRHDHVDYWGSAVTVFESSAPHRELSLTATARVEVHPQPRPLPEGWPVLRTPVALDAFGEYLTLSPTTAVPDELAALAAEAAASGGPDDVARQISARVHEAVEYVPGVTAVHSPAVEAWRVRKGVCQDMAHLTVGALRSVGIPARYVSGYLHPEATGEVGRTVTGESHAWVEWWVGHWVGHDPTNEIDVGAHHVVLGRGREYQDVAPVRGIYAGGGTQSLDVRVRITREA
ncbi:MAG TPA: transglutaminase family protein [Actinotalea sp.]|nr:transglutaminase family protein [Actinotalea sp.]